MKKSCKYGEYGSLEHLLFLCLCVGVFWGGEGGWGGVLLGGFCLGSGGGGRESPYE